MADNSVLKGKYQKLMSIRDIEVMEMEKEALKSNTPHMLYKQGPINSMTRPCKLFIKVDVEGLLTDTISISDVVNFDSHESIVSSSRRIIACFQSKKPGNIEIESVFFYKKRARSTRMNPVKINNTTDGFRAVAEHPTGEVPLGVKWSLAPQYNNSAGDSAGDDLKLQQTTFESLKKSFGSKLIPEDLMSIKSVNHLSSKKRRLEPKQPAGHHSGTQDEATNLEFKNASWPLPEGSVVIVQQQVETTRPHSMYSPTPPPARPVKPRPVVSLTPPPTLSHGQPERVQNPASVQADVGTIKVAQAQGSAPAKDVKSETRHPRQSPYIWPADATMEIVITFNGVKERRKLPPDLHPVITDLLRTSTLPDSQKQMLFHNKMGGKAQDKLDDQIGRHNTFTTTNRLTSAAPKTDITSLAEAKEEIFRVLSMVNVSQARFKQLLAWMRSLRLEEGNQGKFYLSERNIISGTRVTYNTDEEAAAKVRYLMKNRAKPPVTLHPEPLPSSIINTANVPVPDMTNPVLFLMHGASNKGPLTPQSVAGLTPQSVSGGTSLLPSYTDAVCQPQQVQHLVTPQGLVAMSAQGISTLRDTGTINVKVTADKPSKVMLHSALKRKLDNAGKSSRNDTNLHNNVGRVNSKPRPSPHSPDIDPAPGQLHNDTGKPFGGTEHAYTNVPRILRSRRKMYRDINLREYANNENELNPVPTHLISNSSENNSLDTTDKYEVPFQIKEEPVEYESTASDTTEDYNDRLSGSELPPLVQLYTDNAEACEQYNYSDVGILKADERLPQAGDGLDKPFELIVKEEPADSYEDD